MAKRRRRRIRRSRRSSGSGKNTMKWAIGLGVAGFIFWKFILPKFKAPIVLDPQVTLGPMVIEPATYTLSPDAAIMGLGALLNG